MTGDLLPGDEWVIRVPNAKIPFVDYAKLESMLEEYKESLEPVEPTQLFYEDFNPFSNQDKLIFDANDWKIVDVFQFLNLNNSGDSIIVHEAREGVGRVAKFEIDLSNIELLEGGNYLKFEYGALFHGSDHAVVVAETSEGEERVLRVLNRSTLYPDGILVQGIEIPQNTTRIVFYYTYGGGGSE